MMMARKNLIATALLAALVLASAMPSRAGRNLLDEAVDNATAEEMPALSMPAVDNATADVMPAMPAANATADEMPVANATADVMPAAANATETDGASNFNQGSPDCIKPDVTTGLIDAAAGTPDLSTLVAAIKAAGLENAFDDTSAKVTVFAPTDDAFNAALSALGLTAEELLASPLLGDILKYHVVGEPYTADMLVDGISLPTLEGSSLMGYNGTTIVAANGNATIAQSDVYTCQGIVQVIDAVMLPQSAIDALSGGGRRSLLQLDAAPNATAEEMPTLSMPAVDNATADVMPAMPVANATADEMPAANATADVMPAAANATETDGASNFNQGSPDCIKPDVTTGLIDAAAGTPDLSTLVAAIKAAGLENAFDDTSAKVTVFAPTDDAFNAALSALGLTAEELLASPLLGDILKYHVVGEPYTADMLVDGISLPTLEGSSLMGYDGTTIVAANGNATIVDSDVYTCQGIVQVIDTVMLPQSAIDALRGGGRRSLLQFDAAPNATAEEMPALSMPAVGNATAEEMPAGDEVAVAPASAETAAETSAGEYNQGVDACIYASSPATLVETASAVPDFSTLVAALQAADLASAFDDMSQKVTVFAPTNAAFEKLFAAENVTAEEVLANKDFLTKVLKYHVAGSVLPFESFVDGESISTLEGEDLGVSTAHVQYRSVAKTVLGSGSGSATIIQGNVWSCNGVIQVIDEVLLPESALSSSQ